MEWALGVMVLVALVVGYLMGLLSTKSVYEQGRSSLSDSRNLLERGLEMHGRTVEARSELSDMKGRLVADQTHMLDGLRGLEKQVMKMDVTLGHLFLQIQEAQPTGRTALRGQAVATGETLPPFPGGGVQRAKLPELKVEEGFTEMPPAKPGVVKNAPVSAVAEPS